MKTARLIKSTAIIASLTLFSRLLGLARDILIASFLGAGAVSDAFFTAFKLPNVFRRMFAEGAFNAAFVPLYARKIEEEGEASANQFASEIASMLFITVLGIIIFFELTMPWSLNIIGYGLDRTPLENGIIPYNLAVLYAMITMPYLLFMSMMALFSGIMNTHHKFGLPTFALALLNVFMISALLLCYKLELAQNYIGAALALSVTVSGLAQAGLVYWGCKRIGIKFHFRRPKLTPNVKRLVVLGVPGILSAGITQINLVVSHSIATMQKSAASWLTYADRLYQLPLGMIGIAMGVALLPSLSRRLRAGDMIGANTSFNRGMEIAAFLTLPAAVALFIIPDILVAGIYQRGQFSAETTIQVAKALKYFSLGLPAFVMIKVLTPAFFARENTKSPMIYASLSAAINIGLGLYLFQKIGFEGLALATSVAAWVNVACLSFVLLKNKHWQPDLRLLTRVPRILFASLIMGFTLWATTPYVPDMGELNLLYDLIVLGVVCGVGGLVYAIFAMALRAFSVDDIRDAFSKKTS